MRVFLTMATTAVCFTLAAASSLPAQDGPDLSGSWTLSSVERGQDGPRAQMGQQGQRRQMGQRGQMGQQAQRGGMAMVAGLGEAVTITHEADMLTLVRTTPAGEIRQRFALDGSESRNRISMGDRELELVSQATWSEGTLVIVTQLPMGGEGETQMRLTMNEAGELLVETRRSGRMGAQAGGVVNSTYTREG